MADLRSIERKKLELYLEMGGGYVLDFSNRTFEEFVVESISIDPYDSKYDIEFASGSKANRLRGIFQKESNYKVGKLLNDLIEYKSDLCGLPNNPEESRLVDEIRAIAARLQRDQIIDSIETIKTDIGNESVSVLAKSIRDSIEKNQPEAALDRLHTYTMVYFRNICKKHGIEYDRNESLNAIFGKYIRYLKDEKITETEMSIRILKYSISLIDSFNDVRNNKSFAHPNDPPNYDESLLIVNNVVNSLRFIDTIEEKYDRAQRRKREEARQTQERTTDDLPF